MVIASEKDGKIILVTTISQEAKIFITSFLILLYIVIILANIIFVPDPVNTKILLALSCLVVPIIIFFVMKSLYFLVMKMFRIEAIIDKQNNLITVKENGRKLQYTINDIRSIKSTLNYSIIFRQHHSKLLFYLRSEGVVEVVKPTIAMYLTSFPFAFDFFANLNHDMGKAISEAIHVPFTEGEYQPSAIPGGDTG